MLRADCEMDDGPSALTLGRIFGESSELIATETRTHLLPQKHRIHRKKQILIGNSTRHSTASFGSSDNQRVFRFLLCFLCFCGDQFKGCGEPIPPVKNGCADCCGAITA